MNSIPVLDLTAQYRTIQAELDSAILQVLGDGRFILGEQVSRFEQEFAAYCGADYGIGVASGTDALHLALRTCGVGLGDEVITSAHTSVATVAAIEAAGAIPVFVDVDPETFTMDVRLALPRISPKTRAIIAVHLYGCPADLEPILRAASKRKIHVIEDCAQAHGAIYRGKKVGGWGDLSAFSFYPTKNLGAFGDGGMVLTNNPEYADRLSRLRQYGWRRRYISDLRGMNSRLDEIQAAVLRVKLDHLEGWNRRRAQLAEMYNRLLQASGLGLPHGPRDGCHVYHQYVIRSNDRDRLQAYLSMRSIQTLIHYPMPVHLQPAYRDLGYQPGDFPITENLSAEILSLPLYPELSNDSVETVCGAIYDFLSQSRRVQGA